MVHSKQLPLGTIIYSQNRYSVLKVNLLPKAIMELAMGI
jgi:hypothetical protein